MSYIPLKNSEADITVVGGFSGPLTSTDDTLAIWDGTSGEVLKDGVARPSGAIVGTSDIQILTNKDLTSTTNDVAANSLHSATTVVDVSAATAPTVGQVLTATGTTAATWQTPAAGGAEFTQTAVKSAAYTAVSGDWVLCDANAAAGNFDVTLPATPTAGEAVKITLITAHATRVVETDRNASTIDGGTAAEFENYNILWKAGDTVTYRCVASGAWVTAERHISNRFKCYAYLSGAQLNITSSTFVPVLLDAVNYDPNGSFDTVTNNEYTVPITGTYSLTGGTSYYGITQASKRYVSLIRNTTQAIDQAYNDNYYSAIATGDVMQKVDVLTDLVAGDKLELQAYTNHTGNTVDLRNIATHNYLSITLISR